MVMLNKYDEMGRLFSRYIDRQTIKNEDVQILIGEFDKMFEPYLDKKEEQIRTAKQNLVDQFVKNMIRWGSDRRAI